MLCYNKLIWSLYLLCLISKYINIPMFGEHIVIVYIENVIEIVLCFHLLMCVQKVHI